MEGQKRCTICGEVKAFAEFYRDSRRKDGRYSECKSCTAARRGRDREKAREAEARYREKHRDELGERQRAYYRAHREERIAAVKRSRAKRKATQEQEQGVD